MHRKRALAESRNGVQKTLVFIKNFGKVMHNGFCVKAAQTLRNFGTNGVMSIFNCSNKFLRKRTGNCLVDAFLKLVRNASNSRNYNADAVFFCAANHYVCRIQNAAGTAH